MSNKLLAILAHPDDESFGPGGTFAKYAAEGVDVHIAIATDGAAGSVAAGYEDAREKLTAVRAEELKKAVNILGATLHTLGYRDSGYLNDPANDHPEAFINADVTEGIERVVKLIREIKPDVVVTHDETGGYFHPDHIMCWRITTSAIEAAADPEMYPELGLEPFQVKRLYYSVFSNRWVKLAIFVMRLRRQDPTKVGRNKDINLTKLGVDSKQITTVIDYTPYWDVKMAASAEHASQGGGSGGPRRLPTWLMRRFFAQDTYVRAYPPFENGNGHREKDFFADK